MKIARLICIAVSTALAFAPALVAQQFAQQPAVVHSLGVTSPSAHQPASPSSAGGAPHEYLRPMPRPHFLGAGAAAPSTALPNATFQVVSADTLEHGFAGITSLDSNEANGGGIAGIGEPPDQGLATNDTQVFEVVNISFRIFSSSGAALTENIGLPQFFGVPDTTRKPDASS